MNELWEPAEEFLKRSAIAGSLVVIMGYQISIMNALSVELTNVDAAASLFAVLMLAAYITPAFARAGAAFKQEGSRIFNGGERA